MAEQQKQSLTLRITITLAFIAICAVVFYFYKKDKKQDEYDYYAYFNDVKGLAPSSEVQINGVRVGKISDVEFTEQRTLKVIITTQKGIQLPEGTVASLSSGGMTGDKIVKLLPGKGPAILPDKSTLVTNLDTSVLPMSVRITPMIEATKFMLRSSDSALTNFNLFMRSGLISSTAAYLIHIEKETRSYAVLSEKVNANSSEIARQIRDAGESSSKMANNFKDVGTKIKQAEQSTQSLANKNLVANVKQLQSTFAALGNSFGKMNKSEGSLGKLVNDKKGYNSTSSSLDTLNSNMKATYDDPPGFTIFGSSKKKK